ncbi:radical SAM protein [Maribellus comscasis]|uniref:Radical SAM protein n=1 Tax=Maribellus comscasis TaxID=2681766 RepID=A0A6I6JTI8_9BACT|nr:radical SAM protein [Maribellus comscasis]QGY44398.1 radical SAM protein [Maribellus comscasis]
MATFLFDEIIFGPVKSRRLGVSLGINLMPTNTKICSFDCIYCECGRNPKKREEKAKLPPREEVKKRLAEMLKKMVAESQLPDVITFAGNGEPTLHPEFAEIINDTIELRNQFTPNARIAVLSNATMLHKKPVFGALKKIEDNIQKLDSAFEETIEQMDCPQGNFNLKKVVEQLTDFKRNVIIQTMFIRGSYKGKTIDNTTEKEVLAWIELLKKINPRQVMIYTIARDTPIDTLEKVSLTDLNQIAKQVEQAGFSVQVSG